MFTNWILNFETGTDLDIVPRMSLVRKKSICHSLGFMFLVKQSYKVEHIIIFETGFE